VRGTSPSRRCRRVGVGLALPIVWTVVGVAPRAAAQSADRESREPDVHLAADAGAFVPETLSARVGATPGFALGWGGYDSARQAPLMDSAAEVTVWGPLAVRAAVTYSNDTRRMRPSVGGRVQILRQEAHGLDGALTVFYKTEGFTETEGEIETFFSLARRFQRLTVTGNLVYGQDREGNERDGEVRFAAFRQGRRFGIGFDSRLRFAIGAQHAANVEPRFDFFGGPVGVMLAGPVALFAEVGPSAFEVAGATTRAGVSGLAGVGTSF
jgi:hypothetical protein